MRSMAVSKTSGILKVNQLSKDLNIKSKEMSELMTAEGIEYKAQKVLTPLEFSIVFDKLTRDNQIKGIEDYLDGITVIPSKAKEEAKAAESVEPAEPATPAKPSDTAKEEKPKPEITEKPVEKVEEKAEPKAEPKALVAKESAPASAASQKPQGKPMETKPQTPLTQSAPSFKREDRPARQERPASHQQASGNQNPYQQQRPQGQRQGFTQGDRPQGGFQKNGAQQGQRPQQRPNNGYQQNNRQGGGFYDKDDRQQSAPREKFKPQPIVRSQTAKGEDNKQRGAQRVVDMRSGSVDLSKYDEKLDSFVPDSVSDMRGGMQRVKKQSASGGFVPKNNQKNKGKKSAPQVVTKAPTSVVLPAEIVVSDLASRLKVTSGEVVKRLMMLGMMVTVNQTVDFDTAAIVADEMGIAATQEVIVTIEEKLFDEIDDTEEQLLPRPPVVCVMGHVDHGKTSILDAIRHTSVTAGEAGGITQHIGAYRVKVNGQDMTFLDTPGHEAFTAMRLRGAKSTDIAILVVAADDGVMPQTIEAINHAKSAGIDIIVAINKMDKPQANPDNVLNQLTQHELVPEAWGGDVICVPVSAHTGMGIDDLLESVLLVAEVKELKANPAKRARGLVIESKLDRGRGPVATVLVQNGTLHQGDYVIVGNSTGRVRAMVDDKGRTVKVAGPSVPVEIIGLDDVPQAGDELNAVEDERMARSLAEQRREKQRADILAANARVNLDDLFSRISEGVKTLNIIVKADVAGSAEAVKASLVKLSNEEVKVNVIHSAVGGITESDVMLAAASGAIIVGFNVRPDKNALDSAERNEVDIRTHRIIYEIIDEVEAAMKGMLAPTYREVLLGHAEVRQTIKVPGVGIIAGCYVQDGKITRQSSIRIVRDGIVIFEDKISSLRRFKDDVREVNDGYECGVGIEKFNDIREGYTLEAFIMEEVKR